MLCVINSASAVTTFAYWVYPPNLISRPDFCRNKYLITPLASTPS